MSNFNMVANQSYATRPVNRGADQQTMLRGWGRLSNLTHLISQPILTLSTNSQAHYKEQTILKVTNMRMKSNLCIPRLHLARKLITKLQEGVGEAAVRDAFQVDRCLL